MGKKASKKKGGKSLLCDLILCAPSLKLYGFSMDRIASSLHIDVGIPIQNAFDLQHHKHARGSIAAFLDLLSADNTYDTCRESILNLFEDENSTSSIETLSLRAWATCKIALRSKMKMVPPIDTKTLQHQVCATSFYILFILRLSLIQTLQFLAKSVRDFYRLDALKPHTVKNDAVAQEGSKDGAVNLQCSRFKTRLRKSGTNQVLLHSLFIYLELIFITDNRDRDT
jgi:regulator of nonsense transcripts 1